TVFASVFLLPGATWLAARHPFTRREAFYAGFYTLYAVFVYTPVDLAYTAFGAGLVAQAFAVLLLVPAVMLLLDRRWLPAGVLLGLSALAHPFVAVIGGIAAAVLVLLQRDRSAVRVPAIAAVFVAPWLAAALPYLPFIRPYTLGTARPGWFVAVLLPLILYGGLHGREHRVLLGTFL
ncbi:MAG: hypothetical protein ABEK12_01955, partial [Candidatus Nanohaloarchaea archaeon]